MSLAIATASRDDNPNSTIGVASLIASAGWPVAVAIQLRSQTRISATVISVGAALAASSDDGVVSISISAGCESSCGSVMFNHLRIDSTLVVRSSSFAGGSAPSVAFIGECVGHLPAAQAPVKVGTAAGAAADLSTGRPRNRARGGQQHVA